MDKLEGFWDPLLLPPDTPAGQRAAVTAGAGRVAVGAGAGTGKTWVLSSRYARLLLTDAECLPRDILTLTYTEAAASEMRERIERRVRELLSTPGAAEFRRTEFIRFDKRQVDGIAFRLV